MAIRTDVRWPMGAPPSADWFALVEAVRTWRPDLTVEIARKMPRIDEALGLDFASLSSTISDLAIPFAAPYVRGARVAIIDDSVNVGSTLRHAAQALLDLGAADVRAFALYSRERNGATFEETLPTVQLVADEPHDYRSWRSLAAQAPMLISRLNKPYDLDFPVIPCVIDAPFSGPADLFSYLNDKFEGRAFDVSTGIGRELGKHRFSADLGTRGGTFDKVRCYYDQSNGELNLVPIRIATPLPVEISDEVEDWGRHVFETLVSAGQPGPEVRARALLFVHSLALGIDVLAETCEVLHPASTSLVDLREAELIFGPVARSFTLTPELVDEALAKRSQSGTSQFAAPPVDAIHRLETSRATVSPALQHIWPRIRAEVEETSSTDPIVRAVAVFEALARAVGSESTKLYSLDWPHTFDEIEADPYLRLRIGFAAADLNAILQERANTQRSSEDWARTTSKVLDRLIDAGIVVPTIATYDGVQFRVYRKGEADPRDETVDRILAALEEYGEPMSATRLSKVGVITAFAVPTSASVHVSTRQRGNVLALDADLLDEETEISRFLMRTGKIVRRSDTDGD